MANRSATKTKVHSNLRMRMDVPPLRELAGLDSWMQSLKDVVAGVGQKMNEGSKRETAVNRSLGLTVIFLPISFRGFRHFFGGIAKPAGLSLLEIIENLFSLVAGAEMNIGGLRAHGMKQNHFIAFFWKALDFNGISVRGKASNQPSANHLLIGVG